tara:strand:+ start:357 stop:557 length:201 start_codon:yes stop_codon:yes gene_type:complete
MQPVKNAGEKYPRKEHNKKWKHFSHGNSIAETVPQDSVRSPYKPIAANQTGLTARFASPLAGKLPA